jgi:serine/threonine-protein kinase
VSALELLDGAVFAKRYRVLRRIASGGMGAVYEAVHVVTGRRIALKLMLAHTLDSERLKARFLQESRVAAQVRDEHVVDVLDAGIDDTTGAPYLVMELLEGEDLGERLARLRRLPAEEVVGLLGQAAVALDRMHAASIVHRDLKPRNLFLTRRADGSPSIKILDFGVAKMLPRQAASQSGTQNVGTPSYMAPEQFDADARVSAATDVYALGMLAYTLLVGVHYWREEGDRCENAFAFAKLVGDGPREAASERALRAGVRLPDAFDAWFAAVTATAPRARIACASEAVGRLAGALATPPPEELSRTLRPDPPPARAERASDAHRTLSADSSGLIAADQERAAATRPEPQSFPAAPTRPSGAAAEPESSLPAADATHVPLAITHPGGARAGARRAVMLVALLGVVGALVAIVRHTASDAPAGSSATATPAAPPAPLAGPVPAASPSSAASAGGTAAPISVEALPAAPLEPRGAAAGGRPRGADGGAAAGVRDGAPAGATVRPAPENVVLDDEPPGGKKPRERLYTRH